MYSTIYEVPKAFRHLSGWPLSLEQINQVIEKATSASDQFSTALYAAFEEFKTTHEPVDNQWRAK